MKILSTALLVFLMSSAYGQSIEGLWNTGMDGTIVEILEDSGICTGRVHSSEAENAQPGFVLIKDLQQSGDKWKGQLFSVKKKKWLKASMKVIDKDQLKITATYGVMSKTIEWERHE
jgi:uncharacterized protein (DUF2147 family)